MELLRNFADQFPPIRLALKIHDGFCYLLSRLLDLVAFLVRAAFRLTYKLVKISYGPIYRGVIWSCTKLSDAIPPLRRFKEERARRRYERLAAQKAKNQLDDAAPPYYEQQTVKRAITYHAALALAAGMYVFVYFVLIKHHTYWTVSIAFVLMLIYLLLVENSHNLRSILMLCLPIMLTNRGRALVFCSMLALLAGGPISTMQHNVKEIHLSLNCCKQYLIVSTDKNVDENVVSKLVKVEEVVINLVNNIKMFAEDLKEKFDSIIQLAIETEMFISNTIQQLKRALLFCNRHSSDLGSNCRKAINKVQANCNSLGFRLCDAFFGGFKDICQTRAVIANALCELPRHVVRFFEQIIGRKLREYVDLIAREFYVDVDITRSYGYNLTKSKAYSEMIKEIKFDVDRKFWYVRVIRRVFNFVSLILVIWIFLTATIYHMHYLRELSYDNMYLDELLDEVALPQTVNLSPEHERHYLRPFTFHMNKVEVSKLYISGIVWSIIIGYIGFFVALDYALFHLVDFLVETLREILFTSDLPLIDLETKSRRTNTSALGAVEEDKIVRYNRTYLNTLRRRMKPQPTVHLANLTAVNSTAGHFSAKMINSTASIYTTNGTALARQTGGPQTSSSIQAFYDRLMNSLEQDVPDDVAILESLEGCLPKARTPFYDIYWALFYLALFTFGAVIVEAYALRTRHCIANLYYPRRARRRAKWLYRKIISEQPKYSVD